MITTPIFLPLCFIRALSLRFAFRKRCFDRQNVKLVVTDLARTLEGQLIDNHLFAGTFLHFLLAYAEILAPMEGLLTVSPLLTGFLPFPPEIPPFTDEFIVILEVIFAV